MGTLAQLVEQISTNALQPHVRMAGLVPTVLLRLHVLVPMGTLAQLVEQTSMVVVVEIKVVEIKEVPLPVMLEKRHLELERHLKLVLLLVELELAVPLLLEQQVEVVVRQQNVLPCILDLVSLLVLLHHVLMDKF